jgi:hypothetical protein
MLARGLGNIATNRRYRRIQLAAAELSNAPPVNWSASIL